MTSFPASLTHSSAYKNLLDSLHINNKGVLKNKKNKKIKRKKEKKKCPQ